MNADPDLFFAAGIIIGALSFPALLHSFTHAAGIGRAIVMVAVACGCIGYAATEKPTGYSVEDAPRVVMDVVARYSN